MTKSKKRHQLLWLALLVFAAATSAGESERQIYVQAERALQTGDLDTFARLKTRLADYPLLPYLEYADLAYRIERLPARAVARFVERHADTPVAWRMRALWLATLAKRQHWKSFLAYYTGGGGVELRCHYLHALIDTGADEKALAQVEPLWLHGRSRPDACDPVFDAWRAAGRLTSELTWRRIVLALRLGEVRLANYLGRYLKPDDRTWLKTWIRVHRKPETALRSDAFEADHPYRTRILAHAAQRLARRDGLAALALWRELENRYDFEPHLKLVTERRLALALTRNDHPDALAFIAGVEPCSHDRRLLEARLLSALAAGDWTALLDRLESLPPELAASQRWRYWHARALGATDRTQAAQDIYRELALERSFYGFLAADHIGAGYQLAHQDTPIAVDRLQSLATDPAAIRARELRALSKFVDARREWRYFTRGMNEADLKTAAVLAERWGWHDQAIFTLARTDYWDDLELRFPLAHQSAVAKGASTQRLEDAWVYAVIRQESAFMDQARSPVGALGLMQLMPRTARVVARKHLGRSAPKRKELFEPELNIELGTAYLRHVLERLGQHPVLALAAYNAGPHRVEAWLPEVTQDADLWIELVPFKETRGYLRRVLAYTVIYERRLGRKPARLSTRMPPVLSAQELTADARSQDDSSG